MISYPYYTSKILKIHKNFDEIFDFENRPHKNFDMFYYSNFYYSDLLRKSSKHRWYCNLHWKYKENYWFLTCSRFSKLDISSIFLLIFKILDVTERGRSCLPTKFHVYLWNIPPNPQQKFLLFIFNGFCYILDFEPISRKSLRGNWF